MLSAFRTARRDFSSLSEREILALAISSEEEDGRISPYVPLWLLAFQWVVQTLGATTRIHLSRVPTYQARRTHFRFAFH